MDSNLTYQFVRGTRLLEILEEVTIIDLQRNIVTGFPNTTKRQYATDPVTIVSMKLTPYRKTTDLFVKSVASNEGRNYDTHILFLDVTFEDEDTNDNVTFTGGSRGVYNIQPIKLDKINVRVRCNCLDFYHRFERFNRSKGALFGRPNTVYKRKGSNRPPVNPKKVAGMCKHIIKAVQGLRDVGIVN